MMSLPHEVVQEVLSEPKSLAELQSATQVSLPTLRRAVQDLSELKWIRVVGQAATRGGRPAMLFGPDTSRFTVVGVHLQLPGMRIITSDLGGGVLHEQKLYDDGLPSPEEAVAAILSYITRIRAAHKERIFLGIGIASPGFMDPVTGDIVSIGRVPTWVNFPICRRLQAASQLPVEIANDIDCMAFAEFLHSGESMAENLAYVGYDQAVKVSLFLGGRLYKGSLGNAGLIAGNLLRSDDGSAGPEMGSALTVEGVNHRLERLVGTLEASARQPYAQLLQVKNLRERFRLVLRCEELEMPICDEVVHDVFAALAVAVANTILMIQPDVTVIGGLLGVMNSDRFDALEAQIRSHLPKLVSNSTIIRLGRHATQNAAAIGASHHFLQTYLRDPSTSLA